jgi:hypothetical protein
MDKFVVQSRYTRINSWYRAPRLVRFSDRLVRQMIKGRRRGYAQWHSRTTSEGRGPRSLY